MMTSGAREAVAPAGRLVVPSERLRHVVFVRHGETDWNRDYRLQSRAPVPINETGRAQLRWTADALLEGLRRHAPSASVQLWSSPVVRAQESAAVVQSALLEGGVQPRSEIRLHDGLTEFDMGRFTGHTMAELSQDPDWQAYIERPGCAVFPGGETMEHIAARTSDAFAGIAADDEADVLVLVSHGGVIRTIIMRLLGVPCEHFHLLRIANASLTVARLRPPDKLRFLVINSAPGPLPLW